MQPNQPFLIIPKLIEQPTWGGTYILTKKQFTQNKRYLQFKIGQSYEIFSGTKLATSINTTSDERFIPEIGFPDTPDTRQELFTLKPEQDFISLSDLIASGPDQILGPKIMKKYGKMPLLIKINQAQGNSFQLHIRHGQTYKHWIPKAESFYYFEKGLITFGLNPNTDIDQYKSTCITIEQYMMDLSNKIKNHQIVVADAKQKAQEFIQSLNPWQFVNTHVTQKGEVVDLSGGGVHHSWERNPDPHSFGNVLYELQEDVMDPVSTIRSFDQGSIKNDGSVRNLQIEDYFTLIDRDPNHNDLHLLNKNNVGSSTISTDMYVMDAHDLREVHTFETRDCFAHVHIEQGTAKVSTTSGFVELSAGHSCFIPYSAESYTIHPMQPSKILVSYLQT